MRINPPPESFVRAACQPHWLLIQLMAPLKMCKPVRD